MVVKALTIKKTQYTNVLNQANNIKSKRDQILFQYSGISPQDIERINKIIPAEFNSISFAYDLNSIASGYGLTIREFRTAEGGSNGGVVTLSENQYKTTAVSISLFGSYAKFIRFLNDIESSLRLVDVVGLSINQPTVNGTNTKNTVDSLEYTLTLNTYSLR